MEVRVSNRTRAWARRAFDENKRLAAAIAACWLARLVYGYPFSFLFVPDRDVWVAQLSTWIGMILESAAIGVGGSLLARGVIEFLARSSANVIGRGSRPVTDILASRPAPWVLGGLSAAAIAFVWGLHPAPYVHDEAAYLLQARLFATGRWTGPPAPIPEFFEQMYVFVWPFTAAKYPPGFPLALVPGVWLGVPALVPILLFGVSGALIFVLGREISDELTAAAGWLLWTTIPHEIWSFPAIMSQHLSVALCLASWWTLERWRKGGAAGNLIALAFFLGWEVITRPLTALVIALPIGIVVLRLAFRRRAWRQLALPAIIGVLFVGVIPLWSMKTTGNWKTTPLALHVRWYTPYDAIGFGWTPAPPARRLPPDLQRVTNILARDRRRHTVSHVPALLVERAGTVIRDVFPRWRVALLPFVVFALFFLPPEGVFVVASALLLFAAHLVLAHPPTLTVYYIETYPVMSFLAGMGLCRFATAGPGSRSSRSRGIPTGRSVVGVLLLAGIAIPCLSDLLHYRDVQSSVQRSKAKFLEDVSSLPGKAIVFVEYPPHYPAFYSFVENGPDLSSQKVWLVHDLGEADNAKLAALAPDRTPYRYVFKNGVFQRLGLPATD